MLPSRVIHRWTQAARLPRARELRPYEQRFFCSTNAGDASDISGAAAAPAKATSSAPAPPAPVTTWEKLVVGEIVELRPHPQADRLNVCQLNVGDAENLVQIICGAPNARAGARVPVAQIGSKLAMKDAASGDVKLLKIKKSKLRGELSQGMICSEAELGFADHSDGIWILNEADATEELPPVGTPLAQWSVIAARLQATQPLSTSTLSDETTKGDPEQQ
ncbi:TPA: hypothetical protein N0F65_004828 [Lagenidium giganteum]|uniref:tRNA-binding domain-containing protein n=1 Tax=Lagenidium giganteum TaxID=4803 RepID=A0AAV2ZAC7_9STRA|nr:TPA: hypothetical protein N0F65_004828 [Lagenidium giganteum]